MPLVKCNVSNGDLLILKSEKYADASEKLKLSIHMTRTGLSQDSKYLEDIEVCRDYSFAEFKEMLLDLPSIVAISKNLSDK